MAIAAAGGTIALVTHLAKATTRIAVNTSPEPASNVAVSVVEDVAVAGVIVVAVINPWVAAGLALILLVTGAVDRPGPAQGRASGPPAASSVTRGDPCRMQGHPRRDVVGLERARPQVALGHPGAEVPQDVELVR